MEIIDKLIKNSTSENEFQYFDGVQVGKYLLSVQGSKYHYSSPRATINKYDYIEMEIAILNKDGWFKIQNSKVIRAFPRYKELLTYADGLKGGATVFGYVPIELIDELYQYLKKQ